MRTPRPDIHNYGLGKLHLNSMEALPLLLRDPPQSFHGSVGRLGLILKHRAASIKKLDEVHAPLCVQYEVDDLQRQQRVSAFHATMSRTRLCSATRVT